MPPKLARLAGLAMYALSVAYVAAYLYVAYLSRSTTTGGMTPVMSVVTWISTGLVVIAIVAVHVAVGKQLTYIGGGGGARRV